MQLQLIQVKDDDVEVDEERVVRGEWMRVVQLQLQVVQQVKTEDVEVGAAKAERACRLFLLGVVIKARNPNNNNEANILNTLFLISTVLSKTVMTEWWWLLTITG